MKFSWQVLIFLIPALPAAAQIAAPTITAGGVGNAATFAAGISPGSWVSIFGANLATSAVTATTANLVNGYLPTTLGGASVTIDGIPAYIDYASPTQLNVESPSDSTIGTVTVKVTTAAGTATSSVTLAAVQPGLFTLGTYAAAVRVRDSVIINGTGATITGYTTAAGASAGDVLELYATGLGATTTTVAPGLVFTGAYPTSATPTVTIGGTAANVSFSGLVGAGLYQINLTVPSTLMPGTYDVVISQNGSNSPATAALLNVVPGGMMGTPPGMGLGPGGGTMPATGSGTTPTTTTLTTSSSITTVGSAVALTAKVSAPASTGTVTFYDLTTILGTGTVNSGVATFAATTLTAGLHYLVAFYSGDSTYAYSYSVVQLVNVSAAGSAATTTTLSSSAASTGFGTALTLTASVVPAAASGTVTFYDGGVSVGTGTLSSGTATLSTAALPPGTHSLSAVYAGTSAYQPGFSSSVTVSVLTAGSAACTAYTGVAQVVCLTTAFEATLSFTQIATLQYAYTLANVEHWSNLPLGIIARNGLAFGTLNATQLGAALEIAQTALSSDGYERLQEIRGADDILAATNAMDQWGSGNYFIAFYGTPSTTSPWMLQINGHHFAFNHTYNGNYVSGTPYFLGVEPPTFTVHGTNYSAMLKQQAAMYALIQTVFGNATAVLSGTFDDVVQGVSGSTSIDTNYPQTYPTGTTGRGVLGSTLSSAQLALIKTAIEAWVNDFDSATAAALLTFYEDPTALANTYIGYSGGSTLTRDNDYIRIDGPRVWIEFCVQQGIAFSTSYHFHTIWRDKTADYGGDFH